MAKVLVAEHNHSTARYLLGALRKAGHSVVVVDNCLDAWRACATDFFDVLLVDVVMPGIDGFVLAQKALQDNHELQVIFITGFSGVALDSGLLPSEAASFAAAPFHLREIASRVRFLLGQGGLPLSQTPAAGAVIYADFKTKAAIQQQA